MNNCIKHFRKELDILRKNNEAELIEPIVKSIEDILKAFGKEGHSGGSSPFAIGAIVDSIEKSLKFEPLSPILESDNNYQEITDDMYQNTRLASLFKDMKGAYYLDAVVWKEGSCCFTGTLDGVSSKQYVNFPFTPKTFYIDVVDDHIKDFTQLEEVWKYYKEPEDVLELLRFRSTIQKNKPYEFNGLYKLNNKLKKIDTSLLEYEITDEYDNLINCFSNVLKKQRETDYNFYFYRSGVYLDLQIEHNTGVFKRINLREKTSTVTDITASIKIINDYLEGL